ncbi:MAG TPA: RNA polymerase sigma factor [Polyangia bacterium]|jgi:RNA polymerase sigma-70 factor (ECF subfamily)|nr:RNA polymerase sigma factor [Polyangia bacterium]
MVKREGIERTPVDLGRAGSEVREREMVKRCVEGDMSAWRALYDRHFPDVERLVASLGILDAEADDICQEIFVIIYRNLARFRGEARLSTWIYRLATREAIRFARRRRLLRGLSELFARDRREAMPSDWSESEAGRRHYLRQLLDRLPPERRLALVLYEIEGLPVSEIARISDCAENTVWTRLHRARTELEKVAKEAMQ